jgi:hypothetical protein
MPSPQPLNSDGFEDPDGFFQSPNTTFNTPHPRRRDEATESIVKALRRTPGGKNVESVDGSGGKEDVSGEGLLREEEEGECADSEL